ncbi:UPF0398 protein ypsA [Lactobacillus selangorensis]|uniref:UPF0398 protein IV38_GL000376 n=1 Tax=Lactobacillus selangorensis TaxID=81857 RepID=A0A0R2FLL7_9LACO|nr:DUF1273 domain-containing protein [Lactobacillus selangorensis]KRN29491.1 UPF0398 protein ypsA [Lactobacillus selangorensis]KRN33979.1 UPF0398 protein ypsA [Lactobacillus selangorensis]
MRRLWVTGYRGYELNIFQPNDPKVTVITACLQQRFQQLVDEGLEWVITGPQLGVEQWSVNSVVDVQAADLPLKSAVILPYAQFGDKWNEKNQGYLTTELAKSDFHVTLTKDRYKSPRQLQQYQQFMLNHTEGALLVYDPEHPGKPKYDYAAIQRFQEHHDYQLQLIDFYDLEDFATEWAENHNNHFQAE